MTHVEELTARIATLEAEIIGVALVAGRIAAIARELGRDDLAEELASMSRARAIDVACSLLRAADSCRTMRLGVVETRAGARLQIGVMPDSFAYITADGGVRLSSAVPLRWRGTIRRVLEAAGMRVDVPRNFVGRTA